MPVNEDRRVDQTVAATLEQQVRRLRNMQLARRTARASCMSGFAIQPRSDSEQESRFRLVTNPRTSTYSDRGQRVSGVGARPSDGLSGRHKPPG